MYRALLKTYFRVHTFVFDQVMYRIAPRAYGGTHPKNVFHYRVEFFAENVGADDVVLDLACGQGGILKRIGWKIKRGIGLDQNARGLALARQGAPANLEFRESDITGPGVGSLIREAGVTKIVLSHILEHLPNPVDFLRGLEGRELLICVPSEENWYRQTLKDLGLNHLSDPTHYREYTRATLSEHLQAAGYRPTSIGFNAEGEITCRATSAPR